MEQTASHRFVCFLRQITVTKSAEVSTAAKRIHQTRALRKIVMGSECNQLTFKHTHTLENKIKNHTFEKNHTLNEMVTISKYLLKYRKYF